MMFTFALLVALAVPHELSIAEVSSSAMQPSSGLCAPAIIPAKALTLSDFADSLAHQGRYRDAARAYYQLFRGNEHGSPYFANLVEDAGQLAPFDSALREAAAGRFTSAATKLRRILKALPEFGEARFLMGVFQWCSGKHAEARETWRSTVTAPYFTLPPDSDYTQTYSVIEAKKFPRWSST